MAYKITKFSGWSENQNWKINGYLARSEEDQLWKATRDNENVLYFHWRGGYVKTHPTEIIHVLLYVS